MTLPTEMTAIAIRAPGGPEVLVPVRRPVPQPDDSEILVRVAAAGVNRPDVVQRQGNYPPPPGAPVDVPGLEIAGEVVACGKAVQRWRPGDKVMALVAGGGYAAFCTVHESNALLVPLGLSLVEAAAIPETFFTVWNNVFERGRLRAGEWLLVHGGTSGIGTTAIMLAKAFGAHVATTAGGPEKVAACQALGADRAIDYHTEDFVKAVKDVSGRGADLILDMVGGDYIGRNYAAAAPDGRIVQIAFMKGHVVEVDFRRLMVKRLTHTGSTLRPRSVAEKAALARALEERVWPLLAEGRCKPVIYRTLPLAEAAEAHRVMESGRHIGKIVLTLS
jgi:NADPH2:quinone reductase